MHFSRSTTVRAAAVAGFAVAVLAFPAAAGAYLYWGGDESVAQATLDGGGVDPSFISHTEGGVTGLAVSSRYVFFGNGLGVIGRANIDGSEVDPDLINIPQPFVDGVLQRDVGADTLVVAGAHLYWGTDYEGIGRAGIDGGGVEPGFIKIDAIVFGIAVDANHIYWTTEHSIGRAKLNGSDVEPNFIPLGDSGADGIAVADGHIYWGSARGHAIRRASLDGRGVDLQFITGLGRAGSPVVAGGHIYWTSADEQEGRPGGQVWIGRASLDGRSVEKSLINVTHLKAGQLAANALGPGSASPAPHSGPHHRKRVH